MASLPVKALCACLVLGPLTGLWSQTNGSLSVQKAVQSGSASSTPVDSPEIRLDPNVFSSPFAGVGSLSITSGTRSFTGTAVAVSPWYVLTAGHNIDDDDNGVVDSNLQVTFNLNASGDLSASIPAQAFSLNPSFTGFNHPTLAADLALIRLSTPLPDSIPIYPITGASVTTGQPITFVGYGGAGSGDFGYTISASLTRKRVGANVIDTITTVGGVPALFEYDFDFPTSFGLLGGSLGNGIESVIGPGDSGSPAFITNSSGRFLAGINTFTMGSNPGRFGSQGGGVLLQPYLSWIATTASTAPIITAQPASTVVVAGASVTFSVTAESGSALSYQWRKDVTAIPSATQQSLVLQAVQRTDAGVYSVVVSNATGAATSSPAELAVNTGASPQIAAQPLPVSVAFGEKAVLDVGANGSAPVTFRWYEGLPGDVSTPVAGATSSVLLLPAASRATSYWVRVADGAGNVAYSQSAAVSVVASGAVVASQAVLGPGFTPSGAVTVQFQVSYTGSSAGRLECSMLLPAGWKFISAGHPAGASVPAAGSENLLDWIWTSAPPSPVVVTCTLLVPATETADQPITTFVVLQQGGITHQAVAKADPLVVRRLGFHSADTNRDGRISLTELTRLIELYNTRTGTVRVGRYKTASGTEDGFAPDP